MTKRTCPACGAIRYSADDISEWMCECGRLLTPLLNESAEPSKTDKLIAYAEGRRDEAVRNDEDVTTIRYWAGYIDGIKAAEKRLTKEEK